MTTSHPTVLAIDGPTVHRLLPMDRCIELMGEALSSLARGGGANPLRQVVALPFAPGAVVSMPAAMDQPAAIGVKVLTVFPGNYALGLESHQGFVLLFDAEHGRPLAIVDASAITAIRTAAVSGLATRLLAREDAGDLAILGSGVQARSHLAAMVLARPVRRVRAWSPDRGRLDAFVAESRTGSGLEIQAMDDAKSAVDGADIICTVTAASEPVLSGDWLAPGAHINAVGSSRPNVRELDTRAVAGARLFVDRRESALNESGDVLLPMAEGAFDESHIVAELGEVAAGLASGRRSPDEVTLFKSLGLALEDVAAASWVHRRALEEGIGTSIQLG